MFDTTSDTLAMLRILGNSCTKSNGDVFYGIIDTPDSSVFEQAGFAIESNGIIVKAFSGTAPAVGDTFTTVAKLGSKRYRVVANHAYADGEIVQLVCSLAS